MSCELLAASKGGNIYIFMEMQDAGSVCETELRPPCVVHVVHMQADQKFAPQTAFRSAQLQNSSCRARSVELSWQSDCQVCVSPL